MQWYVTTLSQWLRGQVISHPCTCIDIDECATANGGCEQECENTPGSHQCQCGAGYVLDTDGMSCRGLCNHYYRYGRVPSIIKTLKIMNTKNLLIKAYLLVPKMFTIHF